MKFLKRHLKTLTDQKTWALLQICMPVYKQVSDKKLEVFTVSFIEDSGVWCRRWCACHHFKGDFCWKMLSLVDCRVWRLFSSYFWLWKMTLCPKKLSLVVLSTLLHVWRSHSVNSMDLFVAASDSMMFVSWSHLTRNKDRKLWKCSSNQRSSQLAEQQTLC